MPTDPNGDGRRVPGLLSAHMEIVEAPVAGPLDEVLRDGRADVAAPSEQAAPARPAAPASAGVTWPAAPPATRPDVATPPDRETSPGTETPRDLPSAVRFASAAATLMFAAQLIRLGRDAGAGYFTDPDQQHWWVRVGLPLRLGRELAALAHGELHVEVDGQLAPDPGWGPPPTAGPAGMPGPGARVTLTDLVQVAGLHEVPARGIREVVVIARAERVTGLVRRSLDLGLTTRYRLVRLTSLFGPAAGSAAGSAGLPGWPADEADETGETIRVELSVDAGTDRNGADRRLPPALLGVWHRDPDLLLCRRAGTSLLMRYERACPLDDRHVAALVDQGTWVLADEPGCARLWSDDPSADGIGLVRIGDDRPLVDARPDPDTRDTGSGTGSGPLPAGWPAPIPVQVRRARTAQASVDAMLLADADLTLLPMLIQGHDLADCAVLASGRDRHLLLAPGGLLERIPLGIPLYCLGPGPLYLPLGFRIWPQLPPTARRALFEPDEETAVVVTADMTFEFGLTNLRPVWRLWAGPLPPVNAELPRGTAAALAALDTAPDRGLVSAVRRRLSQRGPGRDDHAARAWRERALDAELRGELVTAAELHEQNGDHLRAAHLYERAAREHMSVEDASSREQRQ